MHPRKHTTHSHRGESAARTTNGDTARLVERVSGNTSPMARRSFTYFSIAKSEPRALMSLRMSGSVYCHDVRSRRLAAFSCSNRPASYIAVRLAVSM